MRPLGSVLIAVALLAAPAPAGAFTHGRPIPASTAGWLAHGTCSAVLVTPTRVITAAHCVGPTGGYVRIGKGPTYAEEIAVQGVTVHPRFVNWVNPRATQSASAEAGHYDIAILTLAHAARTRPVPIARHPARVGTRGFGYGFAKAQTALRAPQTVLPDARCRATFPAGAFDGPVSLCAGDPGPGTRARICGGDSGGPLVAHGHVIGLVTFAAEVLSKACGQGPALGSYVDVGALWKFVLQPHPAFLPAVVAPTRLARDGDTLDCIAPEFAPGTSIAALHTAWQQRDLRTGHFTVTTLGGQTAERYTLRAADAGTQIRCRQALQTAGGPLSQTTDWLRVG